MQKLLGTNVTLPKRSHPPNVGEGAKRPRLTLKVNHHRASLQEWHSQVFHQM